MSQKNKIYLVLLLSIIILGGGGYLYYKLITAEQEIFLWNKNTDENILIPINTSPQFKSSIRSGGTSIGSKGEFQLRSEDVKVQEYYQSNIASRKIVSNTSYGHNMQQANESFSQINKSMQIHHSISGGNTVLAYSGRANEKSNENGTSEYYSNAVGNIVPTVLFGSNNNGDIAPIAPFNMNPGDDDDVNFIPVGNYLLPLMLLSLLYGLFITRKRIN